MKSTKVQTLGAYCISCVESCVIIPMRVRGNWPRLALAVTRGAVSSRSLQRGLEATVSIVLGKALLTIVGYPLALRCMSSGES